MKFIALRWLIYISQSSICTKIYGWNIDYILWLDQSLSMLEASWSLNRSDVGVVMSATYSSCPSSSPSSEILSLHYMWNSLLSFGSMTCIGHTTWIGLQSYAMVTCYGNITRVPIFMIKCLPSIGLYPWRWCIQYNFQVYHISVYLLMSSLSLPWWPPLWTWQWTCTEFCSSHVHWSPYLVTSTYWNMWFLIMCAFFCWTWRMVIVYTFCHVYYYGINTRRNYQ